jgi:hypothetical protein
MYKGCVSKLGGTIVAYDGIEYGQIRDAEYNKKSLDGRDVGQRMSSRLSVEGGFETNFAKGTQ